VYMTQGLHRAAQLKPHAVATIFGDRRRSWRQVCDRVARLAALLVAQGLKPGDRVAVIALNSDRYIEIYYAVWWAGGVIVPGNMRWALAEHIFGLRDSGAELLLVDKAFAGLAASLKDACPIRSVLFFDDGPAPPGTIEVEALIASTSPMADTCSQDDALAALFYTGGTTGRSKGVMLTHRSLTTSYLCGAALMSRSEDQIFLHSAPMFHIGDAGRIIGTTIMGGTHVAVPFFSPENVCRVIEAERITDVLLIPTMFNMLREYASDHRVDLSSVGLVAYGAAPITETQLRQAMELFPNAEFCQGYGLTELSPNGTFLLPEFHKPSANGKSYLRSIGRVIVGSDLKIVDGEMNERPRGDVGEIVVRGPGVMAGYWNQPELTRKALVDGWLRTGDAAYMDDDGFVFLVDRMKDMIVSGGENIYSAEIENALSSHVDIVECAVIGIPHEKWGETVHAVVRLSAGAVTSADEIIAHCQAQIARYKCPRSVEFRTEPLPLSGAGKILKTELRKPYWGDGNPSGNSV
jgi:long-chain acyl-CoA synthetase